MGEEEKKSAKSLVSSVLASTAGRAEPSSHPAGTPELPDEPTGPGTTPLVNSVLAKLGLPTDPASASQSASASATDTEEDAVGLIDVYFELEDPTERDVLFDRLVQIRAPIVTEFLRAMLQEDEDDFVRAAAAAELARRGEPEGLARLESDLEQPDDPFFFAQALLVLGELRGPAFYERARSLWADAERDADERREAMIAMETVDPARALAEFVAFVESITDVNAMPDDQLEVAMLAFARHEHAAAAPILGALKRRILAATELDAEERQELADFVQEGIDLLTP